MVSNTFVRLKRIIIKKLNITLNPFPYRKYTNKHKCIFIHIPKTAGTSIVSILGNGVVNRDHVRYLIYLKSNKQKFNEYFKFAFVRNPFDRIVSVYQYFNQGGNRNEDLYYQEIFKNKYNTFEKFVLEFLNKDIIHEHNLLRPQYLFIYDFKGECQVDYIGKFEDIDNGFDIISKKLNISQKLPKANSSKRKKYKEYYQNNRVKEKIILLYKKDFEFFDYSKTIL